MADEMSERLRGFARSMRKAPTKAENMLWQMLRGRKLQGLKFKRQEPMGPYIVDFVCHEKKLIIEADGGQHSESMSDRERDSYFEAKGYKILRFWNDEIERNSDAAALHIIKVATDA
jgi:very-short-patch-repair endonuclease